MAYFLITGPLTGIRFLFFTPARTVLLVFRLRPDLTGLFIRLLPWFDEQIPL